MTVQKRRWIKGLGFLFLVFLLVVGGIFMSVYRAMGKTPSGARLAAIEASVHQEGGRFFNALRVNMAVEGSGMFDMASRYIGGKEIRSPDKPLPVLKRQRDDFSEHPESGLRVTWLGHSTLLIEIDGFRILTDPVWGPRASPSTWFGPKRFFEVPLGLDELPKLDAIIISHDHYDHLDFPTILAIADWDVPLLVPLGLGEHLEYWGVDPQRIVELQWWESYQIGKLALHSTPARHFSGRGLSDRNRTLWTSWAIAGPKHRVYFSGDTGMFPGFAEIGERLGPFDMTMIESGAYNALWADVHLGPEQAIKAHQMLRGDVFMPVHWGTFNLALHGWTEPAERVLSFAKTQKVRAVVPMPGQSVEPSAQVESRRWWPKQPWQSFEEAPVIASSLPDELIVAP